MASALHSHCALQDAKPSAAAPLNDEHWRRAQQLLADLEELDEESLDPYPMIQICGRVSSSADNSLIEGAQVALRSARGHPLHVPCTTGPDGSFMLSVVPDVILEDAHMASEATLKLTVKHGDYAPSTALIYVNDAAEGTNQWLEIKMRRAGAVEVLPAAVGGHVVDEKSGMTLTVPPNAFLTQSGHAFHGDVKVSITCIDPSEPDSLASMPGDFSATDIHGCAAQLRSFGAMHVSLQANDTGESLNVRPGNELEAHWAAKVPLDVLEKGGGLPASWRYDEAAGKWRQDPRPISVDGQQMPKPEQVQTKPDGSWELQPPPQPAPSPPQRRAVPKKKAGKKKGKGRWEEPIDEGLNDWSVAQFKRLFASKQGQQLKMKVSGGGWWNIDSTYLAVLMTGKVMSNGRVLSMEQKVQVKEITAGDIDKNGDLLHQGVSVEGGDEVKTMGAVRVAVIGVDYASRSYARARPQDGVFEIVCQHDSTVRLEVQVDPQPGMPGKVWEFGPFGTGQLGDTLDVGVLEVDLSESSSL